MRQPNTPTIRSSPLRPRFGFEILEPRILLSGDAFGVSVDQVDDGFAAFPGDLSDQEFVALWAAKLQDHYAASTSAHALFSEDESKAADTQNTPLDLDAMAEVFDGGRHELIVVDAGIESAIDLINSLELEEDVNYHIEWINQGENGIEELTNLLAGYDTLSAVHVLSHGNEAALQLGASVLDHQALSQYSDVIATWGEALVPEGDLLLYGCNVALGEGAQLIQSLSEMTALDVAASNNITGTEAANGDWTLEVELGEITATSLALTESAQWQGSLIELTVTTNSDRTLDPSVISYNDYLLNGNAGHLDLSFREAIQLINMTGDTANKIDFALADSAITLSSALPELNFTTDVIGLGDVSVSGDASVLTVIASNSTVTGMTLTSHADSALIIIGDNIKVTGNQLVSSGNHGIEIYGANSVIGGTTAEERNVISDNAGNGILVYGAGTVGTTISGNYIGLEATGEFNWGNGLSGVEIAEGANSITVGGFTATARNVISGNGGDGIHVDQKSFSVSIARNYIGTAADGLGYVGNGGDGVRISSEEPYYAELYSHVYVRNNIIAFNAGAGINVDSTSAAGNSFTENVIYSNGGISIDLNDDGRSPNDLDDVDLGANYTNNFPIIDVLEFQGGLVHIEGSVNYNVFAPGEVITVHFYVSDSLTVDGYAEAKQFLGEHNFSDSGFGVETFNLDFAVSVPDNSYISATLSRFSGTSEFSDPVLLTSGAPANVPPTGTVLIGGSAIQGAVLTASNTLNDPNGNGTVSYQWRRNGTDIVGAANDNYTLTQDDVGADITVEASYQDQGGFLESVVSPTPIGPVANVNDAATGSVTLTGTPEEDQTLTLATTITDIDGLDSVNYNYQWYRDGVAIAGANNTSYTLTDTDVGAVIRADVSFTDDLGSNELLQSGNTTSVVNINDVPTGSLTISGTPSEDQTLTVVNTISDADGLPSGGVDIQWRRDGVDIVGATSTTYTLSDIDVGSSIDVVVQYQDLQGTNESVASDVTLSISNINDAPTGTVTISGDPTEDQTLTVVNTISDADGLPSGGVDIQWRRDGVDIASATSTTYTLSDIDVGTSIDVVVQYQDLQGTKESISSDTSLNIASINDIPTGSVGIAGTLVEGQTLSAEVNIIDDDGLPPNIFYQWYRDGIAIAGANQAEYALVQNDVGQSLSVAVQYTDLQGSNEQVSSAGTAPVLNVNNAPTGAVTISGTLEEDATLTADTALSDADGLPANFSYQWFRDAQEIVGAVGSSIVLSDADVDSSLSVEVTYTDLQGTVEVVESSTVGPVSNINDNPTGTVTLSGITREGEIISVINNIVDNDGLPQVFNIQWYRNGLAIADATSTSLLLTGADVGQTLYATVSYQDLQGTAEAIDSAQITVSNVNDPALGSVSILGIAAEDQTLSVNHNITDPDGLPAQYDYQWYRNDAAIVGATTSTYTLDQGDVGNNLFVVVSYVDGQGQAESLQSSATAPVSNVNDAPEGSVEVTGQALEDQVLVATANLTDADGLGALNYQWYRDGVAIVGASNATYALTDQDVGSTLTVQAYYVDDLGTSESVTSATSPVIINVNDAPTGSLTIDGLALEDQTLTANIQLMDADGMSSSFDIQWLRSGVAISDANAENYTLTQNDISEIITVQVTYVDDQGQLESVVSSPTALISMVDHPTHGAVNIVGEAAVGSSLQATHTLDDIDGINTLSYQWYRNNVAIAGANQNEYVLVDEDVAHSLSVEMEVVDGRGFTTQVKSAAYYVAEALPAVSDLVLTEEPTLPVLPTDSADLSEIHHTPAPLQENNEGEIATAEEVKEREETVPGLDRALPHDRYEPHITSGFESSLFNVNSIAVADTGWIELHYQTQLLTDDNEIVDAPVDTKAFTSLISSLSDSLEILDNVHFDRDLNSAVDAAQKEATTLTTSVLGGSAAVSTGLSVGYVIWTLRSSILVTSLLGSMPAWRFIDPLPILSGTSTEDLEDEESLESMVADHENEQPVTQDHATSNT